MPLLLKEKKDLQVVDSQDRVEDEDKVEETQEQGEEEMGREMEQQQRGEGGEE